MAAPYFITEDLFIGSINIDFGADGFDNSFAAEFEENTIIELFGYDIYKALINDLDEEEEVQTQKYIDIVDGIDAGYTDTDGYLKRVSGLKTVLKYLFYASYLTENESFHTSAGVVEIENANATKSNSGLTSKFVKAYNLGAKHCNELIAFMEYKNNTLSVTYYDKLLTTGLGSINVFGI